MKNIRTAFTFPALVCGATFYVLLLSSGLVGSLHAGPAEQEKLESMKSGTVRIRAGVDEGEETLSWQTGTGFVLRREQNRHYILTVTHVVKGADKIQIEYRHRRDLYLDAKVVRMQGQDPNGIALLVVEGRPPPGTRVLYTQKTLAPKTPVIAIGFPRRGDPWNTTRGVVRGIAGPKITFTAKVDSGNSGGPLLNANGRIVGVVTSTSGAEGFATGVAPIAKTLAAWDLQLPNAPARPTTGIKFPEQWSVLFSGLKIEKIFATDGGYIVFAHEPVGTGVLDRSTKAVIIRLDRGMRTLEKKVVEGQPYSTPSIKPSAEISDAVQRPSGDMFYILRATGPRGFQSQLIHLDGKGLATGRATRLPQLHPPLSGIHKLLATDGDDLLASPGNSRLLRFDPFSGKAKWDTASKLLAPLGIYLPYKQNGAYLANGMIVYRVVAGAVAGKYSFKQAMNFVSSLQSGGLLVGHDYDTGERHPTMPAFKIRTGRLIKLNANFERVWEKNLSLAGAMSGSARKAWELKDGHILAINRDAAPKSIDSVVYLNAKGEEIWRKQIHPEKKFTEFVHLLERPDGSIFLAGQRKFPSGKFEGFIFGLNRKGEFIAPQ